MAGGLKLFSLSQLESGRIKTPIADPKDLGGFQELETLVRHSLSPPKLLQTRTPAGNPLKEPKTIERPFEDENLLKKLIQYKNRIPLSPRIIRNSDS